jgi:hypothetical protein
VTRFAVVVALWIAAAAGIAVGGRSLPALDDPEAARLHARGQAGLEAVTAAALGTSFPPPFSAAVTTGLRRLVRDGLDALVPVP